MREGEGWTTSGCVTCGVECRVGEKKGGGLICTCNADWGQTLGCPGRSHVLQVCGVLESCTERHDRGPVAVAATLTWK